MLGKTFKGMTDEMLAWQTEQFQRLETHRDRYTVHVRPELVVEIAFDGIQTSPRYPGGVALRFARVKGTGRTRARGGGHHRRRPRPSPSHRRLNDTSSHRRRLVASATWEVHMTHYGRFVPGRSSRRSWVCSG